MSAEASFPIVLFVVVWVFIGWGIIIEQDAKGFGYKALTLAFWPLLVYREMRKAWPEFWGTQKADPKPGAWKEEAAKEKK